MMLDKHSAQNNNKLPQFKKESNNMVKLNGIIKEDFSWNNNTKDGTTFYRTKIMVSRRSGKYDIITVMVPGWYIQKFVGKSIIGKNVKVTGQIRSYIHPKQDNMSQWLEVYVLADKIEFCQEENSLKNKNYIELKGTISKEVILRKDNEGNMICEIFLVVKRANGKIAQIPCFARKNWVDYDFSKLQKEDNIKIRGILRSRKYYKKSFYDPETAIEMDGRYINRTEVYITQIV